MYTKEFKEEAAQLVLVGGLGLTAKPRGVYPQVLPQRVPKWEGGKLSGSAITWRAPARLVLATNTGIQRVVTSIHGLKYRMRMVQVLPPT